MGCGNEGPDDCWLKQVWTKLIEAVFLSSLDSQAVRAIQQSQRILQAEEAKPESKSLIGEWSDAIAKLAERLQNLALGEAKSAAAGPGGAGEAGDQALAEEDPETQLKGNEDDAAKEKEENDAAAAAALKAEEEKAKFEAEAQALFTSFDKDGSGDLSELELENALTEMGFAQSEISEMMNAADEDGNGILSFAEFVKGIVPVLQERKAAKPSAAAARQKSSAVEAVDEMSEEDKTKFEAEAEALFTSFDKDGSGDLSELELENALTEMGFAQSEISEMMNAADEDGNGILSFAEFVKGIVPVLRARQGRGKTKAEADAATVNGHGRDTEPKAEPEVLGDEFGVDELGAIGHRIALMGDVAEEDVEDAMGKDVGSHYMYVIQILSSLNLWVQRLDLSGDVEEPDHPNHRVIVALYDEVVKLYPVMAKFKLSAGMSAASTLVHAMEARGIRGLESLKEVDVGREPKSSDVSEQEQFHMGWAHFKARLAEKLNVTMQ